MARNCEKHFVGLNRVFLNEQWKREEERTRPLLHTLTTAAEVRKWIPSIKKDMDYCLRQLSGARKHDYQEKKLVEFEQRVVQLEREHKRFVDKVFQLDPTQQGVPWEAKAYCSKRKLNNLSAAGSSNSSIDESGTDDVKKKRKRKPIVLNILKNENDAKKEDT